MVSDKPQVQQFIALMQAQGVHHAVVCPGSRNAPFSISLHNHPVIRSYHLVDERSAAFFALGLAQQWQTPVAVICTSGTAALNLAPALAEAYYQHVPLLAVTADRPPHWIDQGEGQSIRQSGVFRNYVKASFDIPDMLMSDDQLKQCREMLNEAFVTCMAPHKGPVHLNFPFEEPLYGQVMNNAVNVQRVHSGQNPGAHLPIADIEELQESLSRVSRIMVLAGQHGPDEQLQEALIKWSSLPQCVVLTEAHSNLAHAQFITTIDRLIMNASEEEQRLLVPQVLITLGHNIISRKIKALLRALPMEHWHVDATGERLDTFRHLSKSIATEPLHFLNKVMPAANVQSDYASRVADWHQKRRVRALAFLPKSQWSDLQAIHTIYSALPSQSHLQMGNSSAVRYVLLNDARADIAHYGNRGVAGVDGTTSTAVGAALASGRLTTLLTGELAFFYDSNALWNKYLPAHLKVIVINNGGGGIFRIIEGARDADALEPFFETPHQRTAEALAVMYGCPYRSAHDATQLAGGLDWLWSTNKCSVLEVFTPRLDNAPVLRKFFQALSE